MPYIARDAFPDTETDSYQSKTNNPNGQYNGKKEQQRQARNYEDLSS
jgi:hypothetical protein